MGTKGMSVYRKTVLLAAGAVACLALSPRIVQARGGVYPLTKHAAKVFRIATEPVGSCSQCHNEHAGYDGASTQGPFPFLLFMGNTNGLCYVCHTTATPSGPNVYQGSTLYDQSSHGLSTSMVWPGATPPLPPGPPARPWADTGKCVNCHTPHGYKDAGGLIPNLAFEREENLCEACHGGYPANSSKNVNLQFTKTSKHPIGTSGKHVASEGGDPTKYGASPVNNRHSECEDCHNPHYARSDSPAIAPIPPGASNRILGVGRVTVVNGAAGVPPTYIYRPPNSTDFVNEYEVCFKCHSSWTTLPPLKPDLALFLNTNNPSFHPVEDRGKNANINPGAFANGWTWDRKIYCTDCHTSDDVNVRGPHGSSYSYILKKSYYKNSSPWRMSTTDLCFDCHLYDTYANNSASSTVKGYSRFNSPRFSEGHTFHVGSRGYSCYSCHDSHGSTTNPALIVTSGRSPGLNSYSQTATGGRCSPSCHGSESYTINYAR